MEGDQDRIDQVGDLISAHPEITHNYLRTAAYNIWFTAIAPTHDDLAQLRDDIAAETGYEVINLPVESLYKIRVDFGKHGKRDASSPSDEAPAAPATTAPAAPKASAVKPFDVHDPFDIALVHWAQVDAVGEYPFEDGAKQIAAETGDDSVDEARVLQRLNELKACGVIRRFGAFVHHRKLGYTFNGMAAWNAPTDRIDKLGKRFAALPYVSHCYRRTSAPSWPYNLYAMVHATTQAELDGYIDEMKQLAGLEPCVLVSTKEFKKSLPVYFA